jgi:Aflatoxin regulatory protein
MLTCQCSQDIYVPIILSIVILKILSCYTAILRQEPFFSGDGQSCGTTQAANSTQYQIAMFQNAPDVVGTDGCGYDEDQDRMASQQILGRLHRIQRLINILSERYKTHRINVQRRQEEGSRALSANTGPDIFVFLFPSSTLEHIEADLGLHLRTLSAEAADILRQA